MLYLIKVLLGQKLCLKNKILINNFSLDYNNIPKNKVITIKEKRYQFKKIILCVGKNLNLIQILIVLKKQFSYVGFYHNKNHKI